MKFNLQSIPKVYDVFVEVRNILHAKQNFNKQESSDYKLVAEFTTFYDSLTDDLYSDNECVSICSEFADVFSHYNFGKFYYKPKYFDSTQIKYILVSLNKVADNFINTYLNNDRQYVNLNKS